jgi:hypothetical protein
MEETLRTAYIDTVEIVDGLETTIKIFETRTYLFVYVNQHPEEMHLYNDGLRERIERELKADYDGKKHVFAICNLSSHEAMKSICEVVMQMLR